MSGPKARCPSCGTEWEAPVVFCGECGTPVAPSNAQGDRAARLPHPPIDPGGRGLKRANTLVGALPGRDGGAPQISGAGVAANSAPDKPAPDKVVIDPRRTVVGMPPAGISPDGASGRVAAVTMVSPVSTGGDRETKPGKGSVGGRRARRGSSTNEDAIPRSETRPPVGEPAAAKAAPSDDAPIIEVHDEIGPEAAGLPPEKTAPAQKPTLKMGAARNPPPAAPAVEASAAPNPPAPPAPAAPVAPAAPPADRPSRPSAVPPHEAEETQRLLDDLDAGFESIVRPSAPVVWLGSPDETPPAAPPSEGVPTASTQARAARHEADMAEVRSLFAGIAVAYARPLRDFMIEVAWGEPTKEWLDVALPATQALRRAAAAVELPEVDVALEGYLTALELSMGEATVHREVREMLAGAYAKLIDAMPVVFALEGELSRREPVIVRSLLLQVPGVRHVAIEKLYRAGINALDVFYTARARELADATGLDEVLAAAICERFQRYKREIAELSPGSDRARERAELTALTDDLERRHAEHERAAASWTPDAAARRSAARTERADAVLRIDVLLAHLGEVDLQRTLAKVPFQQKIRELRRYLEDAQQKAARS